MRLTLCVLVLASLLPALLIRGARADDPKAQEYVIGIDDVIDITVLNHQDLDRSVTVLSDGSITYPWTGRIIAAGRTPRQLADQIQRVIEKTRNQAVVTVSVKEIHSRRIRVIGAVKTPNAYDLKPQWRLLDIVALAGGFTVRPTLINGRIIRHSGSAITLNVADAVQHPETDSNPVLESDDLILLDELAPVRRSAQVLGQVQKPGAVDLPDDAIGPLALISQVGGVTDRAGLTRAHVLRAGKQIPLNLYAALIEGKPDANVMNFAMQPGDVLFIPEIETRFGVMGQVQKPGYFPFPELKPMTLLDALSQAGGQTVTGDLRKAGLVRLRNGKPEVIQVDIDQILKKGNTAANTMLQADDVLYIPSKTDRKFQWTDILSPLTTLAWLGFRPFH